MKIETKHGFSVKGSFSNPTPGWNTGWLNLPTKMPITSGEYKDPGVFFGNGECADVYMAVDAMCRVMVLEHQPYINRTLERAFRKKQYELLTMPGVSNLTKTALKKYWSLPLELLRPEDQLRMISAASTLLA